jgi:hypothetical protein
MLPAVKTMLHAETIRDGGSLAATFRSDDGAKWILFLQIRQAVHDTEVERPGFKAPVLIDADPTKRPMDAEHVIRSELPGPTRELTWEEAQTLVEQIADLAPALDEWAQRALSHLRFAVGTRGGLPPDVARSAPTFSIRHN